MGRRTLIRQHGSSQASGEWAFIKDKVNTALRTAGTRAHLSLPRVYAKGETRCSQRCSRRPAVVFPLTMAWSPASSRWGYLHVLYRSGVRIRCPLILGTSARLYLMEFVFWEGVRKLQEKRAAVTAIPGFPHSEFLGIYTSGRVLAQLSALLSRSR